MCCCQQRTRVAGRDDRVSLAALDEVDRAGHRAVFLAPHCLHRRIIHLDDFGSVNNLDARVVYAPLAQLRFKAGFVADEEQPRDLAVAAQRVDRPRHNILRGEIAAHGIHGNLH